MTSQRAYRMSGLAAILCGLPTAIFWFLHPAAGDPKAAHDAAFWAAMQTFVFGIAFAWLGWALWSSGTKSEPAKEKAKNEP